ncbi:MAG TPA: DUF1015 domain-containing protein [Bacteroidia bacterium]|jgi:uncharacterized protein (DUF1015 family)|nr:DUF1015 domain-containing protein [Bacteroidia bacterium]
MATIIPFKGIRPAADKVHMVVTRSADNYKKEILKHKLETNPYSFLHIINPDFADGKRSKPGSPERLKKTKQRYLDFLKEEIFIRDHKPCYYLYQQFKGGNIYTGLVGCSSVEDYKKGVIKKHEQTLKDREEKLKEYLEVCDFNAEPVLFFYPNNAVIEDLISYYLVKNPAYDFTTTDRVRHKLWIIGDKKNVDTIRKEFEKTNAIYIADGHHRSASSASLAESKKAQNPNHTGKENYNYYMGIFFSENQLKVFDFNRVVTDLNGYTVPELLEKIKEKFRLLPHNQNTYRPEHKHKFSMYMDGKWYELKAKPEICGSDDAVKKLDASILSDHILAPILGIDDLRTNKRVAFVPGVKGAEELKEKVDSGKYAIAFGLFPVSMTDLKHIADINGIMPPKTTWVEPKIRSGLVIYSLAD